MLTGVVLTKSVPFSTRWLYSCQMDMISGGRSKTCGQMSGASAFFVMFGLVEKVMPHSAYALQKLQETVRLVAF